MLEAGLSFAVVIFVQLILFITHAYYEKRLSDIPRILGLGVLVGTVVGLLSDLVWGKFFGLWSYTLGFGAFFLALNAALLYGIFAANTLLMQRAGLAHFFIWTMIIMAGYEITNHFFYVWKYEFTIPFIGFVMFLVVGYFLTAVFVAIVLHMFLGQRFFFINDFFKE